MQERVDDLLDDAGVDLDRLAGRLDAHALAGRPRRLLPLADEARVEATDRHQPRAAEAGPHLAGEPVHEADVLTDGAPQQGQLGVHLGDVGRDLGDAAGEEREVVVPVELQLREHLRDRPVSRRAVVTAGGLVAPHRQGGVELSALEVGDRLAQPGAAREEHVAEAVDLREASLERAAGDDELADQIHQPIQSLQRNPDRLAAEARGRRSDPRRGAPGRRRQRDGRRYRRRRRRGPGHRRVRRQVAGADRRQGDRRVEQRGEARARGGGGDGEIEGRVGGGVQHALEAVDRGEAGVEHRGGERGASLADGDQQILQPVRELADRTAADDEGGALERVDGAEERGDSAFALERQHGRRHGVEMLGRLGSEVGHHVVVGREEPPELFAQWVRGRVRRGRWRHRQPVRRRELLAALERLQRGLERPEQRGDARCRLLPHRR